MATNVDIHHEENNLCFQTVIQGYVCSLDYELDQGLMRIYFTGVPAAVSGFGIAAALTQVALETARTRGWRIVPVCPFVAAFIGRNKKYEDLLV